MSIKDEWALVFSGGGVKGSYEIGVWQSLMETGFDKKITGVAGTSVGALNSALFVLGDFKRACDIWLSITQEDIVSIDFKKGFNYLSQVDNPFLKSDLSQRKRDIIQKIIKEAKELEVHRIFDIIKKGTIKRIIEENINNEELKSKGIKLYATCSALYDPSLDTDRLVFLEGLKYILNNIKGFDDYALEQHCVKSLKKNTYPVYFDINETRFDASDILMASAGFPIALEKTVINDIVYIDGGVHDNTPIKPLYEIGYRNFICVYLNREDKADSFEGANIIEIRPSDESFDKLKRVVLVNQKVIREQMLTGFVDGMRVLRENKMI